MRSWAATVSFVVETWVSNNGSAHEFPKRAQASYLKTLTKAEASKRIDALNQELGLE